MRLAVAQVGDVGARFVEDGERRVGVGSGEVDDVTVRLTNIE